MISACESAVCPTCPAGGLLLTDAGSVMLGEAGGALAGEAADGVHAQELTVVLLGGTFIQV